MSFVYIFEIYKDQEALHRTGTASILCDTWNGNDDRKEPEMEAKTKKER